ncbi:MULTISPECIES: sugar kinase [Terrabacteria group]|uniref:sugar kinase n=1 Tax=Bacillati TaxID=1783272 RepID=UPI001C6ED00A|nr:MULTISPECIES: sugar kinase [Terrabacteria group]MBW9212330.1 sugar kinase [Trueperella sp. zg.1013]
MKVITFGEIMLRLAPHGYYRFGQSNDFEASFGGCAANVAVSLANFQEEVSYITKLPKHAIGQWAVDELKRFGVDTSLICRGGNRLGIYYLEKGASQRASQVIYDRAHSSFSEARPEDFDWSKIFQGADWFHFTGITPALNPSIANITLEACQKAKKLGLTISCDLNFRKKLWTSEQAKETMSKLVPYVDVCIANEEDADKVFGIKASSTNVLTGELSKEGYEEVAKKLQDTFGCQTIAITLRKSLSASENLWSAMLYENGKTYFSKEYHMHIVDRVGGGDSFGAGLIYACRHLSDPSERIEFAVAASCLKHSIEGDFNRVKVNEVLTLAQGDGSGRVQR